MIATQLFEVFEVSHAQEAVPNTNEAVSIFRPWQKENVDEYAPRFVHVLMLATACHPSSEAGVKYAKKGGHEGA